MGFKAYAAGLPDSAVKLITDGLSEAYGEDVEVSILDVDREMVAIRQAADDDTVLLVCFDSVAYDRSKSFENGLFKNEKFHKYEGKRSLTEYLNTNYDLDIPVPEDTQGIVAPPSTGDLEQDLVDLSYSDSSDDLDSISYLGESKSEGSTEPISGDATLIIENLLAELAEYRNRDEYGDDVASAPDPETETKIFELESSLRTFKSDNSVLESKVAHYEEQVQKYRDANTRLESKIVALNTESGKRERTLSKQAGTLRENEAEISRLRTVRKTLDSVRAELDHANTTIGKYNETIKTLQARELSRKEEIRNLKAELEQVDSTEGRIEALNSEVSRLNKEVIKEQNKTSEKIEEISELKAQLEGTGSLDDEVDDLEESLRLKDQEIDSLNTALMDMRVEMESINLQNDAHHEDLEDAVNHSKLAEFESSILGKLQQTMLPGSTPAALDLGSIKYTNIIFVFSGTTDSAVGVYRQLKNISNNFEHNSIRGLIADFYTDSFADYILQVNPKKGLIDWLENGGSIQKLATQMPRKKYTEVVSLVSEGYINDLYLLEVDWATRLKELNESGYRTVVYMGSLSTVVGRVLFSSIAGRGNTRVYTEGNMQNTRSLYQNLSGLPRTDRTTLYFYDLIPIVKVEGIVKKLKDDNYNINVVSRIERGGGQA